MFSQLHLVLGDVDEDGQLNIIDIVRVVEIVLDLGEPGSDHENWAADVNADDIINVEDVVMMVDMILSDIYCNEDQFGCYSDSLDCCIRTTSHEFEWEVLHFGDGTDNFIKDTWIFDNGHIWCVGQFWENGEQYSAKVWDGESWHNRKLLQNYQGIIRVIPTIRSMWAFSEEDIWFAAGTVFHYSGNDTLTTMYGEFSWTPPFYGRIWASSPENIYFADPWESNIGFYDGNEFTDIDSLTDVPLLDIWGIENPETNDLTVWTGGFNDNNGETILLANHGEDWELVSDLYLYPAMQDTISSLIISIWTSPYSNLYVNTGAGIYIANYNTQGEAELVYEYPIFSAYIKRIRGNSDNDIFIAGINGDMRHFNGETWYTYDELRDEDADLTGLAFSGNTVVAVGWCHSGFGENQGVIIRGIRSGE
ncbi:MAG: hypothetical protein HN921_02175 [Bacteroidetes bacterium]|nr:hypothetical protein [Cytophagia bacterium]MBT7038626.1 hypothetical protein [Bacteroidota bacterium]